ncbi:MAG: DUF1684 domain-containing protein [Acidobacteriota bacterium]
MTIRVQRPRSLRSLPCLFLCGALLPWAVLAGCASESAPSAEEMAAHREEVEAWRSERLERLRAEEGWLTLVGLDWLSEGANAVGSDPGATVVLPAGKAPERLGVIHRNAEGLRFEAAADLPDAGEGLVVGEEPLAAGESRVLQSDASGEATTIAWGDLSFFPIERGDRVGMRIKDRQSATRLDFPGIEIYPVSFDWRLAASFEAHDPPRTLPIVNVLGQVEDTPSAGAIVFEHAGQTHRLDVMGDFEGGEAFVVFGDATNGDTTYGGGRFLYAPAPDEEGRLVLDFNRAYNPPCAFTAFSTCPLPPAQNKLPVAVTAGEKRFAEPKA